jgi:polyhydroxyalkanoate synthesis regulator phasin
MTRGQGQEALSGGQKMSSKKRIAAVAITIAALTAGSVSVASADDAAGKGVFKTRVLAELVKAGTITQAQADAISKKLVDVKATMKASKAIREERRAAREAVVTSTLGIDAATVKSRLVAGETLATIAGAKKDALITALVAFETKEIDAAVTAGKLTAAQATKLKANLTKNVTAGVEKIKGPKGVKGSKAPRN